MKQKVLAAVATSMLALALIAAAPASSGSSSPVDVLATAQAAKVSKSQSGGGGGGSAGNVTDAGDRLGELVRGWAVPVIIVLAGCLLVGALASRNIGTSVGIVVISMIGLIFLLAPESIESFAEGIANFVF